MIYCKRNLSIAAAITAAICLSTTLHAAAPADADLLFVHGQVKTPTGWTEAVAVRQGVIVAVGDNETVQARAAPTAKVVDLGGDALLPGLHDSHVHPMFAGLEEFDCRLPPASRPADIAAAVRSCAASAKAGEWIRGGNWVAATFAPGQQTRALLDRAAPDNPVLLNDEAHHSVWVNSAALRAAGIGRATPKCLWQYDTPATVAVQSSGRACIA